VWKNAVLYSCVVVFVAAQFNVMANYVHGKNSANFNQWAIFFMPTKIHRGRFSYFHNMVWQKFIVFTTSLP
jgi:hypothetical protein